MKVVRSGDLVSYCAEEGVRILGEGKFLVSDSFPGNERTRYCLTSKVNCVPFVKLGSDVLSKLNNFGYTIIVREELLINWWRSERN